MFFGKLFGLIFGFMFAGPIGALIGAVIGHNFDKGLRANLYGPYFGYSQEEQARIQKSFFSATFSIMGHIAKADGHVSEDEIRAARNVMRSLNLNAEQTQEAINLFRAGKDPQFNLEQVLDHFIKSCHNNRPLLRMFLEMQFRAAFADGQPTGYKLHVLNTITQRLGFSSAGFSGFQYGPQYQRSYGQGQRQYRAPHQAPRFTIKDAYATLEVPESASDAEVKKAYRKLMSQNHPDKLVSKGLPEEMMKVATEKTQKIKSAYDDIRKARGI